MTRIDTSPAALRALADEWDRLVVLAATASIRGDKMAVALRAVADEKELDYAATSRKTRSGQLVRNRSRPAK